MSVRIQWGRRADTAEPERRFDLGGYMGSGGFSFPSVNASGSSLILDRAMESYSGSEIAYRCVQIISTSMASLDLGVEREVEDENGKPQVELDTNQSLAALFNKSPNSAYSAVALKRIVFEQLEITGQAFVYLDRADSGAEIAAIAPIMANVLPVIDDRRSALEKALLPQVAGFQVQTQWGTLGLLPYNMLWLRYPHPTIPFMAVAPWKAAQWAADLDRKARQWQAAEFANGAKPTGVISLGDVTEDQAQRVQAQFESKHSGTSNAGRHLFLWGPTKAEYSRIGRTGQEMGYLDSHAVNAQDICHAFGVPIDLIIGQATYDNRHSAWVSLWTDTLTPKLELVEGDVDRQLLPDTDDRAVFDRSKVAALQENVDAVAARATQTWINDGCTLQEYRGLIGLEPLGTPSDEMIFSQLQAEFKPAPIMAGLAPIPPAKPGDSADGKSGGKSDDKQGDGKRMAGESRVGVPMADVHRSLDKHEIRIQRAVAKLGEKQRRVVMRRFDKMAERIAKGHEVRLSSQDVYDEAYWTDQTVEALDGPVDDAWTDGATSTAVLLGLDWALVESKVAAGAKARIADAAQQITATTAKKVESLIQRGLADDADMAELSRRVDGVFTDLVPNDLEDLVSVEDDGEGAAGWRAAGIARMEAVTGYFGGSMLSARSSDGVVSKTWEAQPGCCVLCDEVNGLTVAIDDSFNGYDGPPIHANCRCVCWYNTATESPEDV